MRHWPPRHPATRWKRVPAGNWHHITADVNGVVTTNTEHWALRSSPAVAGLPLEPAVSSERTRSPPTPRFSVSSQAKIHKKKPAALPACLDCSNAQHRQSKTSSSVRARNQQRADTEDHARACTPEEDAVCMLLAIHTHAVVLAAPDARRTLSDSDVEAYPVCSDVDHEMGWRAASRCARINGSGIDHALAATRG